MTSFSSITVTPSFDSPAVCATTLVAPGPISNAATAPYRMYRIVGISSPRLSCHRYADSLGSRMHGAIGRNPGTDQHRLVASTFGTSWPLGARRRRANLKHGPKRG